MDSEWEALFMNIRNSRIHAVSRPEKCFGWFSFAGLLIGMASAALAVDSMPAPVEKPVLWLSASSLADNLRDGLPVLRWDDQSGNGYDAVYEPRIPQAGLSEGLHCPPRFRATVMNGSPAIGFDASDRDTLILNRAGHAVSQDTAGFSVAILFRAALTYGPPPAPGAAWTKNRYLFITHLSDYNTRMSVQVEQDTGEILVYSRSQPGQKIDKFASFSEARHLAVRNETWHRLVATVDYAAKKVQLSLDGVLVTRDLPPTTKDKFEWLPSPITGIGSTTLGDWLTCDVAELLCYQHALSPEEISRTDTYFAKLLGK